MQIFSMQIHFMLFCSIQISSAMLRFILISSRNSRALFFGSSEISFLQIPPPFKEPPNYKTPFSARRFRGPILLRSAPVSSAQASYIQFRRYINLVRYIFSVFLPLPDAFRQKILYLAVHGPEVVLRPGGDGIV